MEMTFVVEVLSQDLHVHDVVILPVNEDAIALMNTQYFVNSEDAHGALCHQCACTRT